MRNIAIVAGLALSIAFIGLALPAQAHQGHAREHSRQARNHAKWHRRHPFASAWAHEREHRKLARNHARWHRENGHGFLFR